MEDLVTGGLAAVEETDSDAGLIGARTAFDDIDVMRGAGNFSSDVGIGVFELAIRSSIAPEEKERRSF